MNISILWSGRLHGFPLSAVMDSAPGNSLVHVSAVGSQGARQCMSIIYQITPLVSRVAVYAPQQCFRTHIAPHACHCLEEDTQGIGKFYFLSW